MSSDEQTREGSSVALPLFPEPHPGSWSAIEAVDHTHTAMHELLGVVDIYIERGEAYPAIWTELIEQARGWLRHVPEQWQAWATEADAWLAEIRAMEPARSA